LSRNNEPETKNYLMKSDEFTCASFATLFSFLEEYDRTGILFGIPKELFFIPKKEDPFKVRRYGQVLESPLGVAAGPHTQLSQNIITAWLTGARYMELKTVQVLDELNVSKPCIDMSDEGYNCEWSQELKLDQSFSEYLNAWIMLHILRDKLGFDGDEAGFIFNMSVGYNLEGIKSPTVQLFLDRMEDCSEILEYKLEEVEQYYPKVRELNIPSCITKNITISTMHGCPPDEIEKIGRYFIEERKYDTTIKLNPTLLGPEKLRWILNEKLGFHTVVPDLAFEHDLKYDTGIALIQSLLESAEKEGVAFNLKLTNTLETSNIQQLLPKNEEMVYMSGRSLHPISINLAARLQKEFEGRLDISFSAGADVFNIADILKCGLQPTTVCSDILKPGGYGRLAQYFEAIQTAYDTVDAGTSEEYILKTSGKQTIPEAVLANLEAYAEAVLENPLYHKENYPYESIKTKRELEFFDCADAPCMSQCPAGQEIPRYLEYTARGDYEKAYKTIAATNAFPNVQGKVCDHVCESKCTRINYEKPLFIREIKRFIADKFEGIPAKKAPLNGLKVSIVGAGPAGLSCAYVLAMEGFEVEVLEAKGFAGGMAADGIPVFRLDDGSLNKDIEAIQSLGVKIHFNRSISSADFEDIRKSSDYVYLGVGAQKHLPLNIPGEDAHGVYDQLTFLSKVRRNDQMDFGNKIVIIGAGNSAMDAARTAKRLIPKGDVTIVYRRTRREMPCDPMEVKGALEEGVNLLELAAPVSIQKENGKVKGLEINWMTLGAPDESGRARPEPIPHSTQFVAADTIIPAIGQKVVLDFFPETQLIVDPDSYETQLENVFSGGDAYRGASSLINAIADGQKAALQILKKAEKDRQSYFSPKDDRTTDFRALMLKQAKREMGAELPELSPEDRLNFNLFMDTLGDEDAKLESERCLQCDLFCNICTTVCPNRSNMFYTTDPIELPIEIVKMDGTIALAGVRNITQPYQIINVGDFCNECGNCTTFCPTSGQPFKDKPKFHITEESFESAEFGFYFNSKTSMEIKTDQGVALLKETDEDFIFEDDNITVHLNKLSYRASNYSLNEKVSSDIEIGKIAEYISLYQNVRKVAPFK
jgi:putative selenate reductase